MWKAGARTEGRPACRTGRIAGRRRGLHRRLNIITAIGGILITPFILAADVLSFIAFAVCWLKGGHPERFGAAVLLFHAVTEIFYREWRIDDLDVGIAAGQVVLTLIFGWLAFRSARWWPIAVTASLVLILLVHFLAMVTPISYAAAISARIGLWLFLYLIMLSGVAERWTAGEAPVSRIGRDVAGGAL